MSRSSSVWTRTSPKFKEEMERIAKRLEKIKGRRVSMAEVSEFIRPHVAVIVPRPATRKVVPVEPKKPGRKKKRKNPLSIFDEEIEFRW